MALNVLGLIPARGGSKGIPRKNITPLAGKPLIAHTIQAALASQHINRVIVSTDDQEIAVVSQQWGAEVPFLRPPELARDDTPALPVIQHMLHQLDADWKADIVVYLQPTSPLRTAAHIDAGVEKLLQEKADTVVSVVEVPHQYNPVSVMDIQADGSLTPYLNQGGNVLRRQDKPHVYARNGPSVLVCTRATIMQQQTLYGKRTFPLLMKHEESLDIDTPFDLMLVELVMIKASSL